MADNNTVERKQSMEAPEQGPADILLLGQNSGQDSGQMAGQAPSLSVEEVHALGTELCFTVRNVQVEGSAMAAEMPMCRTCAASKA